MQNAFIIETDDTVDFFGVVELKLGRWTKQMDVNAHSSGNFIDHLSTEKFNLKITKKIIVTMGSNLCQKTGGESKKIYSPDWLNVAIHLIE